MSRMTPQDIFSTFMAGASGNRNFNLLANVLLEELRYHGFVVASAAGPAETDAEFRERIVWAVRGGGLDDDAEMHMAIGVHLDRVGARYRLKRILPAAA